ncbi:MAG TPA: AraC family transcriptional regulator [Alloacidobacterium sp.]|nr:AraC family transcriptional regulator [Alloacidobacterium sp.]
MIRPTLAVSELVLASTSEPAVMIQHEQILDMVLRPGSIEVGLRRTELTEFRYVTGEMILPRRHVEEWVRSNDLHVLSLTISDAALSAAGDGSGHEVALRSTGHLVDARVEALVAAVNAERIEGFPSGRVFLDSVEQAIAAALISRYAVRDRPVRVRTGGLTPAQLRRVTELVDAKIETDLSLHEMAESVHLSTAHFSRMFRKSMRQSPHQFVLGHRVARAKEMLRAADARVLDVAVACGFRTQQHFARVFRRICGASPTEYRREYQHCECFRILGSIDLAPHSALSRRSRALIADRGGAG